MATINDIMSALKTRFEYIQPSNGFDMSVKFVQLGPITIEIERLKLPAIAIQNQPEELLVAGKTNNRYSTICDLFLLVRDNDALHDSINSLISDIKKLIYDSLENYLTSYCLRVLYRSSDPDIIVNGGIATALVTVEIIWYEVK